MIEIARRAGRIQEPALFLLKVMEIERVDSDRRIREGPTPESTDINERMNRVAEQHGLSKGRWWPPGTGPVEAEELTREYMRLSDLRLAKALREFGLGEEATLLENDPSEFHRRRELGRRVVFEGLSDVEMADALRQQFLGEAEASAVVGSYHAAAAMIGAAMEAALLARCLRAKDKLRDLLRTMPHPPKSGNPLAWKFADMCRVAEHAGWLPDFQVGDLKLTGESLINMVRDLRNMLHPAKQVRRAIEERHGVMVVQPHYEDALDAYELLQRHLSGAS